MSGPIMRIRRVARYSRLSEAEELLFERGVNLVVGAPNCGKTKWLTFIDFALGDDDTPEAALGIRLAELYDSVEVDVEIGSGSHRIRRDWKAKGLRGKVLVDDSPLSTADFSDFMLSALKYPKVKYPKGDPYARTWPELSFRSLLRHVYRKQNSWNDLADRQPEIDQHACLSMFLGLAEKLFSDESNEIVQARKKQEQLIAQRDNYLEMLTQISKGLLEEVGSDVVITAESLNRVLAQIDLELTVASAEREAVVRSFDIEVSKEKQELQKTTEKLQRRWTEVQQRRARLEVEHREAVLELQKGEEYQRSVMEEEGRLERAAVASLVFEGIQVTHCPACDQPIDRWEHRPDHCFLCKQSLIAEMATEDAEKRLQFERARLEAERAEAKDYTESLKTRVQDISHQLLLVEEDLDSLDAQLRPIRSGASAFVPPALQVLDIRAGQLQEKRRQVFRLRSVLEHHSTLTREIDDLSQRILLLEASLSEKQSSLRLAEAASTLQDGINDYLNQLERIRPEIWIQGPVRVTFSPRNFSFRVGGERWRDALGGTLMLYFLLAYQYSLIRLSALPGFRYPGTSILDFPATMEGVAISDKENFVLEPFVSLFENAEYHDCQLIAAGNSFENFDANRRIELGEPFGEPDDLVF
jgi:hypothetical protein